MAAEDILPPEEHALLRLGTPAEEPDGPHGPQGLLPGDVVVLIEHGDVVGALIAEDVLLGRHILRHVLVDVQMVGSQIGHHGDMGAAIHGHQLEAGQLQHRPVLRLHIIRLTQQGLTDVAAHVDGSARRLQQLCDDGGGGGLAVAAGDGDHVAGADLKEHLHLAGEGAALPLRRQQLRHVRPQTRCAEDNVLRQAVQIPLPQMERGSGGLQLIGQRTQLLPAASVAGGDGDTLGQQAAQQRRIADADADDRHGLMPQRGEIFL